MRGYMPSRKEMRRLCEECTEGDGADPRKVSSRRPRHHPGHEIGRIREDRKALQLCRQISQTLDEVFAESRDDVLRGLHVLAVEPAPDASRLLVTVLPEDGVTASRSNPTVIVEHLSKASGYLRGEVTTAITRKRTPLLAYRVAASSPEC